MDVFLLISSLVLASLVLILTWSLYYAKRSPSVASAEKKQHEDDQLQGPEDARKFDEKDGKSSKTTKKRPVPASKENKLFTHPWLVTTLKGHTGQVLDMDFSPSGKYLVTCSEDRSLIFWTLKLADAETLRELSMKDIRTVKTAVEFDYASRVCWSPDSKAVVAVKATANQIEVYKVGRKQTGGGLGNVQLGLTFPKNRDADIIALGLASTGRYIMSCTDKTEVDIWDLKGQILNSFTTNQMMTYCAKISPCGRFVASSGFTPDVKVWEVVFSKAGEYEKVTRAFELTGHTSGIWSFDFTPDSSRMATVSKDGTWRIYDTKIEHQKGQLPYLLLTGRWPHEGKPAHISIAPDCRTVAIGTVHSILVYSAQTGELEAEIDHVHAGEIKGIRFDSTSKFILTTGDRYVRVFRNIPGYRVTISELEQKLRTANTQALKERIQSQIEEARRVIQLYS